MPPQALAPNIMISILAKKMNVKMLEVPVFHQERKVGRSSLVNWKLIKFSILGLRQLLSWRNTAFIT
jgi:hypothetical protein